MTEWTPFPKNGDADTSLEKSYMLGVLVLEVLGDSQEEMFCKQLDSGS